MSFYFEKSAYNVLHITHTKNYTTYNSGLKSFEWSEIKSNYFYYLIILDNLVHIMFCALHIKN